MKVEKNNSEGEKPVEVEPRDSKNEVGSRDTDSKPCPKFKSWRECYHTCLQYPVCRRYYRVMEDVE